MHTKNSTQIQRNDLKNEVMISFQSSTVHFILVFIYFILLLIRKNMDREEGEVNNYRSSSRRYNEDEGRDTRRVFIKRRDNE